MEFWWCCGRPGPSNVRVFALGLSCDSPRRPAGRRKRHDSSRAKTRTFEGPGRPKHHQNSTRRPPEREKKTREDPQREKKRHELVTALTNGAPGSYLDAVGDSRHTFHPPRPGQNNMDDGEPGSWLGWQVVSSMSLEERFVSTSLWPRLTLQSRALFRSQGGPMASVPFTSFPISHHSRFDSHPFRVLLLRLLWLPLPSTARTCLCGLPLDSCGHHRAACSVAGVLGRRGFAVESAAARVCRAGARVSVNVRVQDMDLALPDALDNRCLEIVADGLPLSQGAQLAVDTTLVSVLRRDGVPRLRSTTHDGAALVAARRRKERVYPELTSQPVGESQGQTTAPHLRARARQVWRHRWASLLACSAAKAFALSLLEGRSGLGSDGDTPLTTEVISDHRHLPFTG